MQTFADGSREHAHHRGERHAVDGIVRQLKREVVAGRGVVQAQSVGSLPRLPPHADTMRTKPAFSFTQK
jgi:hypothetical protein